MALQGDLGKLFEFGHVAILRFDFFIFNAYQPQYQYN